LLLAGFFLCLATILVSHQARAQDFDAAAAQLAGNGFPAVAAGIDALVASGDDRAIPLLIALQDGNLHARRGDNRLVLVEPAASGFAIRDAITGEALGEVGRRDVRRVAINNNLRAQLRGALGALQLFSPSETVRMEAARGLLSNAAPESLDVLTQAIEKEDSTAIRDVLVLARAIIVSRSGPLEQRLAAVEEMSGSMRPEVWQVLGQLINASAEGDDKVVADAAQDALASIETQRKFYSLIETMFFGLSLGAVLMLAAVGLAITFGVMRVINMAHGEMLMLGAYTAFVVQQLFPGAIEYSLFLALPLAFVLTGALGMLIERTIIRVLYGRPLETLLATFGLSLVLQQAVRTIFSPLNQPVVSPDWMSGFYEVNGALSLTYNRLYIILFCFLVFILLQFILRRTHFGLQMRAVTQNRRMASSMGIRTGWVDALTFGLGSGIAGVAGVALSQLTNVGPNMGQAYIIDSFMVVVFGGVGSLWGTMVAAMSLGVANKFLEPFTGAVFAKILVLVLIILFIQRRPQGLFALKGRAVEH
jgi:urea transport system permease protein